MSGWRLPDFNLSCNIWWDKQATDTPGGLGGPDVVSICNLQFGKKIGGMINLGMWILLPALTDVRGNWGWLPAMTDVIELPAGSGRYYVVVDVDDVSKGFPTEYRVASVWASYYAFPDPADGWAWPRPVP